MKMPPLLMLLVLFFLATSVTSLALVVVNPHASTAGFASRWWSHAWQLGWAAGIAVVLATILLKR